MSYLCLTIGQNGVISGTQTLTYTTCPAESWVGLPLSDVAAYTSSNLQTLFDTYFVFNPELAELLSVAYFVSFITGYGAGMVVKGMRRV